MIRFILVNHRIPARGPRHCAACGEKLEDGYIHEPQTDLKYCDAVCFSFSEKMAIIAIEHHARQVS